jgi:hypothetical protein
MPTAQVAWDEDLRRRTGRTLFRPTSWRDTDDGPRRSSSLEYCCSRRLATLKLEVVRSRRDVRHVVFARPRAGGGSRRRLASARQDDEKFLAAEPADHVTLADARAEI